MTDNASEISEEEAARRAALPEAARRALEEADARQAADAALPKNLLSFMNESRRLTNRRIKLELRVRLRHPTVREGIEAATAPQGTQGMRHAG